MTTPFWSNEPTILFNKNSILQLWPLENQTFETKLNAISRLVIVLTILGFFITQNINLLIIGVITLGIIYSLYKLRKQELVSSLSSNGKKEGFKIDRDFINLTQGSVSSEYNDAIVNPVTLETIDKSDFYKTSYKNPMSNVLLTDIGDDPDRLAAPPSFNYDINNDITKAVKKQTQMLNSGIKGTSKQLYGDLKDSYDLDQSMSRFYSTANSRVTNDQGALGQWLYGDAPSAKESGPEANVQRVKDNLRYNLI
jgi:hypothetical protein